MRLSTSCSLFSVTALSGLAAVSGVTRECIATVRATAVGTIEPQCDSYDLPADNSITFEVRGKGTGGIPYSARRDAEKGMTKCLKNYFDISGGSAGGWVRQCAAHHECAVHVTPYNDPLEDTIIQKLLVEKLGHRGRRDNEGCVEVKFDYLSIKSPDGVGGHGCRLPPGFEHSQTIYDHLCGATYNKCYPGCSERLCDWCT